MVLARETILDWPAFENRIKTRYLVAWEHSSHVPLNSILGQFHPQRSCVSESQLEGTQRQVDSTRTSSLTVLVEIHSLTTFVFLAFF